MNYESGDVDLTNCDREPIHLLGKIQGFGALIAVNSDWLVVHHSENLASILNADFAVEIGAPLRESIGNRALDTLKAAAAKLQDDFQVERIFGLDLTGEGHEFDIAVHCSGKLLVFEFEPHDAQGFTSHLGTLRPLMAELERCETAETLCDKAAVKMKQLLGFDRVMVYRFHPDLSGEVMSEAREDHLESFHGLRYPKTDIPAQARELYKRNLFRIISDVNDPGVPVTPATNFNGEPLDLSLSTLRAVSPIHIEYLKNMGVGASLSISIIIRGELWGMFACHHYGPRNLAYSLRTVAELFSQLFSLMLDRKLADLSSEMSDAARAIQDRLMTRLASGGVLADDLAVIEEVIGDVVPHDGSSAFIDGIYRARGKAPTEAEFLALVGALNSAEPGQVIATTNLAERIEQARGFADRAAGALVIPVSRRPRDYLVLWRQPLSKTVTWAGNPEKPVEYGPNGARLTPRKSFEQWQQTVEGTCSDWKPAERRVAEGLRVTLLEVILKLTDQAMEEREKAQQQQELLIAELNHRVRNILNLIRSLISHSSKEAIDVPAFSRLIGGRISALAAAHDHITRENWSAASLKELITTEAGAYLTGKEDRVGIEGADQMIAPEAYTILALVIHEMMTNSAKYGALCDRSGSLTITLQRRRDGDLEIRWRESGGPPVKPPSRRGFGSTIIERSIPHELKGEAKLNYKLSGLEAMFVIPGRYLVGEEKIEIATADTPATNVVASRAETGPGTLRHVLVVEDSMIIALDAEDTLKEIGVAKVSLAASVSEALDILEADRPDLALLDYNLGTESSEPVARRLNEIGVPFIFATGYGEVLDDLGAAVVLKKPYSSADIGSALEVVCAG